MKPAQAMKADPLTANIPVVFLSAKGQESEIRTGMDAGAAEYLFKPFAPMELSARVANCWRSIAREVSGGILSAILIEQQIVHYEVLGTRAPVDFPARLGRFLALLDSGDAGMPRLASAPMRWICGDLATRPRNPLRYSARRSGAA